MNHLKPFLARVHLMLFSQTHPQYVFMKTYLLLYKIWSNKMCFHCDWRFTSVCLCQGEHQHSRQCVPGVGVSEGAPYLHTSELHSASSGLRSSPATTSMDQPTGLLQVSTLRLKPLFTLIKLLHPFTSRTLCVADLFWNGKKLRLKTMFMLIYN